MIFSKNKNNSYISNAWFTYKYLAIKKEPNRFITYRYLKVATCNIIIG